MWLTLAALLISAEPTGAEALYKKMDEQVLKAKTLQTQIEITAVSGKDTMMSLKGRVLTAEGDKGRFELDGDVRGTKDKMNAYSDGKKMLMTSERRPGKEQDTKKGLNKVILASLSRSGLFVGIFMISPVAGEEEVDIEKLFPLSDFKLGKKEKIGTSEAQIVEYKLTPKNGKDAMEISVWIDTKTNLPLKRTFTVKEGKGDVMVTETYTKMTLNDKIDDKEFALPK